MQIIDGYCAEPNIYADDIGEYNMSLWGTGDYVLPVGERLGYELVSNNEIRIKDGMFLTQGRRGVIKKGTSESCAIENGTQAENRNDLIVIEYAKDSSTLVESHTLKVIKGTPGETAADPAVVTGDIAAGAVLHQMPLYRVKLEGLNVTAIEKLFSTADLEVKKLNGLTFAQDAVGNWGYKVGGADPVIPFSMGYKSISLAAFGTKGGNSETITRLTITTIVVPGIYLVSANLTATSTAGSVKLHDIVADKSESEVPILSEGYEGDTSQYTCAGWSVLDVRNSENVKVYAYLTAKPGGTLSYAVYKLI